MQYHCLCEGFFCCCCALQSFHKFGYMFVKEDLKAMLKPTTALLVLGWSHKICSHTSMLHRENMFYSSASFTPFPCVRYQCRVCLKYEINSVVISLSPERFSKVSTTSLIRTNATALKHFILKAKEELLLYCTFFYQCHKRILHQED